MMMRRRLAVLVATAVVMTGGFRAYWGPIHMPEPIGRCIKGGIDLNDLPFTQASFKGPIVGIASSGGGSRAAYLSAAVLREIRRAGPALLLGRSKETQQSLLDQVDAFSSVSGGSLAASYFVVNSEALERADADVAPWNDYLERMAIEYRKRQWYGEAAINPWIWAKTIFTDYNRGVLARDDYDAVLFNGKDVTLAQLPDRPVLYLNAFDVGNSVRFVLSKHYIETQYFWLAMWGSFDVSLQPLLRENDLSYINVDPASIRVADAVYASSSFPSAYPNLAVNHCGKKIFNRGRLIFLADGGLADNSGLVTLLTQLRASFDEEAKGSTIDASVDQVDPEYTKFQDRGTESRYAWEHTIVGHAQQSIFAAIELLQDLVWQFIGSTDIAIDQPDMNWAQELTARTDKCGKAAKASWDGLFESGVLAMRPLVIRLGLQDLVNPDVASTYAAGLEGRPELGALLKDNGITGGVDALWKTLRRPLGSIPTDFALTVHDRRLLDLAAFLLVQGKLAGDVAHWNEIDRARAANPSPPITCTP
jgi:predicted acylesterase/phospholipase RssA